MENKRLNENGITLVALVLTVVIMVIMAGITTNALIGDNGILGNVMNAKIRQEDEGAKEQLQLAWSARMSKFYEDVAAGRASFADISSYFADYKEELNRLLGTNGGQITRITYNEDGTFDIRYTSSGNINYIGKIKTTGEIIELKRTEQNVKYTEVWANFFESGLMTYTIAKDESATISWDITNGMSGYKDAPWYYDKAQGKYVREDYAYKVKKVEIKDEIAPVNTDRLFYHLEEVEEIEGLEKINSNKIGNYAFYSCDALTTVNIPNRVTSMGDNTFYGCDALVTINIPSSVTSIGNYVFAYCKALTIVNIPNSITSIGNYAFYSCDALVTINIPNSVTSIGERAFVYCKALTTVNIPNSVTSIGKSAFYGCTALTTVNIQNGVTSIGDNAFYNCLELTNITIPESVEKIGKSCFVSCTKLSVVNYNAIDASKTDVYDVEANTVYQIFGSDLKIVNIGENVKVIPEFLFAFSGVEEVNIANGLKEIKKNAFERCEALKNIKFPNSVTSIGERAFMYCEALTTVNIPNSVTSIGEYAFYSCTGLEKVVMTNSITSVGEGVFSRCSSLKNVTISENLEILSKWMFEECSSLENVTIPSKVTTLEDCAFVRCSGLTNITIPENVEKIGKNCFASCTRLSVVNYNAIDVSKTDVYDTEKNTVYRIFGSDLKTVNIGENVKVIPEYLFAFSGVEEVNTIANSLKEIKNKAFYKCSNLKNMMLPESVTSIGNYVFRDCTNLQNIIIPKNITSIGEEAFYNSGVESITIPETVKNLGWYCFAQCKNLDVVNYLAVDADDIPPNSKNEVAPPFSGSGKHLYIGNNVKRIPNYMFRSMVNCNEVVIPESVEKIGKWAFENWKFQTLEIPYSVNEIGLNAFYNCTNLTKITIKKEEGSLSGAPWGAPDATEISWEP
ncbi:MAG: leucine-rich repeat protein [Clostridia bacterium]|nr:leucine-rich repeat protein [Clostridia bacterium]